MNRSNSVQSMWKEYLRTIGETTESSKRTYTSWYFCDNEKAANELATLVKRGIKRATTSAYWVYKNEKLPLPSAGEYSVITNWSGNAQCIIWTSAVQILPFDKVRANFAKAEGEGDGSLEYWRRVHWEFFGRELSRVGKKPEKTMRVVCEWFEVIYP